MSLVFAPYRIFKITAESKKDDPVIVGLLNRREFAILSASAKTGKSMFALRVAIAIASGKSFLGFEVVPGKVMYLQTEISDFELRNRIERMLSSVTREQEDAVNKNVHISTYRLKLDRPENRESLKSVLEIEKPDLLILDPFYELHSSSFKEDSSDDVAPLLREIKKIAHDVGCAILLIHHQGKKNEGFTSPSPSHSHRGSSSFGDVPDASISMIRKGVNTLNIKADFRNRPALNPIDFRMTENDLDFQLIQATGKTADRSPVEILKSLFGEHESNKCLSSALRKKFCDRTGLSDSMFNKLLKQLKDAGQLASDRHGRDQMLSFSENQPLEITVTQQTLKGGGVLRLSNDVTSDSGAGHEN